MLSSSLICCICLLFLLYSALVYSRYIPLRPDNHDDSSYVIKDATVLILGGGVAGIIAARTLLEQGISEFLIVEAGHELGGRLRSRNFGGSSVAYTVETGANWVQGYGPENPIHRLATKHGLKSTLNTYYENVCQCLFLLVILSRCLCPVKQVSLKVQGFRSYL
jgi:polyamine oxidase